LAKKDETQAGVSNIMHSAQTFQWVHCGTFTTN